MSAPLSPKQFGTPKDWKGTCANCGGTLSAKDIDGAGSDCLDNPFGPDHTPEAGYPR